jgi:hypothetical protein
MGNTSSGDWAFHYVVWDGDIYRLSEEMVEIEDSIGQVDKLEKNGRGLLREFLKSLQARNKDL